MISVLRLKIDFLLVLDDMLFYQIESEEHKKLIHVSDYCRLRIHQLSYFMHIAVHVIAKNNNGNNFLRPYSQSGVD